LFVIDFKNIYTKLAAVIFLFAPLSAIAATKKEGQVLVTIELAKASGVSQQRFSMVLLCGFGLLSLVLGAAGLYGVMSNNVLRQKREIGVRIALGARREDVAGMVLRDAEVLVGIGLVIGIAASLFGAKLLAAYCLA
jgi:ABC-type antimicrobial peptide transport system permease subunit